MFSLEVEPTGFTALSGSNQSNLPSCNSGFEMTSKNLSINSITALSAVDDFSSISLAEEYIIKRGKKEEGCKVTHFLSVLYVHF